MANYYQSPEKLNYFQHKILSKAKYSQYPLFGEIFPKLKYHVFYDVIKTGVPFLHLTKKCRNTYFVY